MGASYSKKFNPLTDLPDLSGKVIIVTGGNTGIGLSTVKHFARKGAKVYLAARNESKATGAIASLQAEGLGPGNGEVIWWKLDLSDPREVKKSAEEFMKKEQKLDILVNNAAALIGPYVKSFDGIVDSMMVNHIGPFVFTRTLLPLLKQTAKDSDVRIVNVASNAHKFVPPTVRFSTIDELNESYEKKTVSSFARYAHSKLANILFTKELNRRLEEEGANITTLCLDPGMVNTFWDKLPFPRVSRAIISLFFVHPDHGAFNSTFAAASPEVSAHPELYRGAFIVPVGKIETPTPTASDKDLAVELWATTENFLQSIDL